MLGECALALVEGLPHVVAYEPDAALLGAVLCSAQQRKLRLGGAVILNRGRLHWSTAWIRGRWTEPAALLIGVLDDPPWLVATLEDLAHHGRQISRIAAVFDWGRDSQELLRGAGYNLTALMNAKDLGLE